MVTMEKSIFSVRQVNSYIKMILEEDLCLNCIGVTGEISNFKNHPSGHLYFTLKDESAAIRCVMFKSAAWVLDFIPENGMKVIISGRVSLYEKAGDCQLYAEFMKKAGTGALFENFEKLKQRLMAEGLFDDERKKKIPQYVNCVAVVTSKSGAAVRDIIQIINRRNKYIKIAVAPVQVQGVEAAIQIAEAIKFVNDWGKADCIIVGRGGGSYEDLQSFNEEIVARGIASSKIPIISAVGHETDFTIADFVADFRAPTPSAAAELVSFSLEETEAKIQYALRKANRAAQIRLERQAERVTSLKNRRALKNPAECIYERQIYIHSMQRRAQLRVNNKISEAKTLIGFNASAADNLSPLKTMSRGYALISDADGKMILKIDELPQGEVKIIMSGGTATAEIYKVDKSENGLYTHNGR